MKKNILIVLLVLTCAAKAQVTPYLQITVDKGKLEGFCNLGGADVVYMHSGLGTTDPDQVWQHIVGHWGLADGLGKMTRVVDSTYSICINVRDYYTNLASADSLHGGEGIGPMPAGATPYNIGVVFRNEGPCPVGPTGDINCIEGKDPNCKDIFIYDLPSGSPVVIKQDGDPFDAVEAHYVSGCAAAIHDISDALNGSVKVFPNPFEEKVGITLNVSPTAALVQLDVYDVVGNKVADLTSKLKPGHNYITWNGKDNGGVNLPSGTYVLKLTNGGNISTARLIKR
ncbi:MAG: T9SS type A sorting domain-containing protein [Chitinophagales bacterium]